AGIQDRIAEFEYDLNIYNVRISDDLDQQVEYLIKRGMADGYLLISIHMNEKQWGIIKKLRKTIALIDEYQPEFDSVSVDSVEGAYQGTKYLIDCGYHRIAMITAQFNSKPSQDRIRGYSRALQDSGRIMNHDLIVSGSSLNRDGFTEKNGYEAMLKLFDMNPMPDAVFCNSDIQAMGALKAMNDRGIHLPILGFDDLRFSEFLGLSSMRQPMYEMGWLALEKL